MAIRLDGCNISLQSISAYNRFLFPLVLTHFSPSRKHTVKCTVDIKSFMEWEQDELRSVKISTKKKNGTGTGHKVTTKEYKIPAPYDRVVAQLSLEDEHARYFNGHEAIRRQSYAIKVLNEFAKEITNYKGPAVAFRSRVLTPILQRHRLGIEDTYGPSVRKAILHGREGDVTIGMATEFYLGEDPTDPGYIPTYRRNLVYVPMVRWHLGVIMGVRPVGNELSYEHVLSNSDALMKSLHDEESGAEASDDEDGIPKFTKYDVQVVVFEKIDTFFTDELASVV